MNFDKYNKQQFNFEIEDNWSKVFFTDLNN